MKNNIYAKMLNLGIQSEAQFLPSFQSPFKKAPSRYSIQGKFKDLSGEVMGRLNRSYKILATYLKNYAKFQASRNRASAAVDFAAFEELFKKAQTFTAEFGNMQKQVKSIVDGLGNSINNDSRSEASGRGSLRAEALFGLDFSPQYVQWGDRAIHAISRMYPEALQAYDEAIVAIQEFNQALIDLHPKVAGQPIENEISRLQNTLSRVKPIAATSPPPAPSSSPAPAPSPSGPTSSPAPTDPTGAPAPSPTSSPAPADPTSSPAPTDPRSSKEYTQDTLPEIGGLMSHRWVVNYAKQKNINPNLLYTFLRQLTIPGARYQSFKTASSFRNYRFAQTAEIDPATMAKVKACATALGIDVSLAVEIVKELVGDHLLIMSTPESPMSSYSAEDLNQFTQYLNKHGYKPDSVTGLINYYSKMHGQPIPFPSHGISNLERVKNFENRISSEARLSPQKVGPLLLAWYKSSTGSPAPSDPTSPPAPAPAPADPTSSPAPADPTSSPAPVDPRSSAEYTQEDLPEIGGLMSHRWVVNYAKQKNINPNSLYTFLRWLTIPGGRYQSFRTASSFRNYRFAQTGGVDSVTMAKVKACATSLGIDVSLAVEIVEELVRDHILVMPTPESPMFSYNREDLNQFTQHLNRHGYKPDSVTGLLNYYSRMYGQPIPFPTHGMSNPDHVKSFENRISSETHLSAEKVGPLLLAWHNSLKTKSAGTNKKKYKVANVKRKAPKSWGL